MSVTVNSMTGEWIAPILRRVFQQGCVNPDQEDNVYVTLDTMVILLIIDDASGTYPPEVHRTHITDTMMLISIFTQEMVTLSEECLARIRRTRWALMELDQQVRQREAEHGKQEGSAGEAGDREQGTGETGRSVLP